MVNSYLVTSLKKKLNKSGWLLLAMAIAGCSEQAPQNESQAAASAEKVKAVSAVIPASDELVKPTLVPTTNEERRVLLDSLNITADSPEDKKRLALFVRYTYFADNPQRQLATLEQLIAEIATMRESRPDDHELTALYGSAISLQTVFFLDNLGKTNLLSKKGSRYLDRAVKNAPNNLGVRLYRGITYAEMPAFLGKARQAVKDFQMIKHVSDGFSAGNSSRQESEKFAAMVNYYYAMALIKNQQQDQGIRLLTSLVGKEIVPWSKRAAALKQEQG
ncbi:hypothetical protein SG34_030500 [Thalassomonas viridans]|uniref:Uncharacterized protein n=1 Tax=Thalassomonas viridans TaxID=137584 RepID=A0AAF0CAX8_9GAMM|nr:hypothetical protein [Thalassomonas viridans]WDE09102.1 hypothetical protein SG34_030500 [Thalassomonas viridans]